MNNEIDDSAVSALKELIDECASNLKAGRHAVGAGNTVINYESKKDDYQILMGGTWTNVNRATFAELKRLAEESAVPINECDTAVIFDKKVN